MLKGEKSRTIEREEFSMEGCIISIHIANAAGAPMTTITTAHLVPGRGIEGDRFYTSRGMDAISDATTCDVTFVEQEAIEVLKREEPRIDSGDTARRNIVVRGGSLRQLVGRTFRVGEVVLHGLAPHESCASEDTQQATSCMALQRADLRAHILTEGMISVGDRIQEV